IAVSADGGRSFATPVSLTGGKLTTFIARANGTVLATGLLGATVVGYRSRDAGATFDSWSPHLHPRGFGERGTTLFVATDDTADGFALASSQDDGDSWTPRLHLANIEAIRGCVQQACVDDCWQKVTIALWPTAVCGERPSAEPGADGGVRGGGGGGGCVSAGSGDAAPAGILTALLAIVLAGARRTPGRHRGTPGRGRRAFAAVAACLACIVAPGAAHAFVQKKTPAGVPERLPSSCLALEVHLDDFPGVDPDAVRAAVTGAARAWSADSNPCTSLTIALTFAGGPGPQSGNDGVNVIGARTEAWCPDGTD